MFSSYPEKDFSRNRKLPLKKVVSILLSMQGGTLTTELLKHFNCSQDIASSSAFIQQRSKLNSFAFPTQENFYGGTKGDLVKVFTNLQSLLDNAILLETHDDKGKGTAYIILPWILPKQQMIE